MNAGLHVAESESPTPFKRIAYPHGSAALLDNSSTAFIIFPPRKEGPDNAHRREHPIR